jgi:deoxyribonuclease-4
MRIGCHVSASGGLDRAIDRAVEMGAETIQIFGSSPRSWLYRPVPPEQTAAFREKARRAGIAPVFLHGVYLINLGTPDPEHLRKGIASLVNDMRLAAEIGASGVIFHPGSHGGAGYEAIFDQTVSALQRVLEQSPEGPWLVLENTAGMGQHIGARFEEIGRIMRAVGSPRLRFCLDTQHGFAAGYNVAQREGLEATIGELEREIGLSNLVAVHANDTKTLLGSGVDRHENIGQGHIGIQGFEVIMAHPALRDIPFLLEVPGFEGTGPDKQNVDILKQIRARLGLAT